MLQQSNEAHAGALANAADAEELTKEVADPGLKLGHQPNAHGWSFLARGYELQNAVARVISFQRHRNAVSDAFQPVEEPHKGDFIDRFAAEMETIGPFSATALAIAIGAVAIASLLHWLSGQTPFDLRFGIYVSAILATGLLAGLPAAVGTAAASVIIVFFAFMPPYFALKWPSTAEQISLAMAAFASVVTLFFTYCCRSVLWRLRQREVANSILVSELEHRGKNILSINQVIVRKSCADEPERADKIIGRFRAVHNAHELITRTTACPITIGELLLIEFKPFGGDRVVARGPEVEVATEKVRHLLLLFHELVTNAVKYGALSSSDGKVFVDWRWNGGRRLALTWSEEGGPEVLNPSAPGFGSQLMAFSAKALDGTIESDFRREGFVCRIAVRVR